jgi:hypothetical protein
LIIRDTRPLPDSRGSDSILSRDRRGAVSPRRPYLRLSSLVVLLPLTIHAEIIDRIAVSVGNTVITASDLDREIRITSFLNGTQPDFTPVNKRATAERLIEQKLIRREIELSRYPVPDASAVGPLSENSRRPADYGITEQEVKDALLWQLTLLRFVEVRFRPGIQVSDQEIQDYFEKTVKPAAQAAHPGETVVLADYRDQIEEALAGQRADRDLDTWLSDTRKRMEIVFHEEVFQ